MKKLKRAVAVLLTAAMIFSSMPVAAFAVTDDDLLDDSALDALIEGNEDDADLDDDELDELDELADETAEEKTAEAVSTGESSSDTAVALDDDETLSGYCGGEGDGTNLTWTLKDGTLTIAGNGQMKNYDNHSPWRTYGNVITAAIVEDGVASIGDFAFAELSNLTSVELPESIITIGIYAFRRCSSLEDIDLPENITTIDGEAFENCSSLVSILLPDKLTSIGQDAFSYCTSLESIDLPDGITTICAFNYCTSLTNVTLPPNLTSIAGFSHCNLTSINLPDGVTSIGDYAFSNCTSLTSINLPDGVTSVGQSAFFYCTSLTSIDLPDGVTSIGNAAFLGCTGITNIEVPESVVSIEAGAFANTGLESFCWPESVDSIEKSMFLGCTSMTDIELPSNLTSIGELAFWGCSSLTNIDLPDSITSIGGMAFNGCTELTSVDLPDGITSINEGTFGNCTSLVSVNIPEGVTAIENSGRWNSGNEGAFRNCTSLTTITLPDTLISIGNDTFSNCKNLATIKFVGDCPEFADTCFSKVTATAYYPNTWASAPKSTVGGATNITWVAYDPDSGDTEHIVQPVEIIIKTEKLDGDTGLIANPTYSYKLTAKITSTDTEFEATNLNVELDLGDTITADEETSLTIETLAASETRILTWNLHIPSSEDDEKYVIKLSVTCDDFAEGITCLAQDTISVAGTDAVNYKFEFGKDSFLTYNIGYYEGLPNNGFGNGSYYIENGDFEELLKNLNNDEIDLLAKTYAQDRSAKTFRNNQLIEFDGSCHGMALAMALFKIGLLDPYEFESADGTAHGIPVLSPSENNSWESMVNIYHITQCLWTAKEYCADNAFCAFYFGQKMHEMYNRASSIGKVGSEQQPYLVSMSYHPIFQKDKSKAHTIVCYGAETGNFGDLSEYKNGAKSGVNYDKRLRVADVNMISSKSSKYRYENQYIYISSDWTDAFYTGDQDYNRFGYFEASISEMDGLDYSDLKANRAARIYAFDMSNYTVSNGEGSAIITNNVVENSDIALASYYIAGTMAYNSKQNERFDCPILIADEDASSYVVTPSNDNHLGVSIYFDDIALTVNGTASSATFNSDGTVTVKDAESDIEISAAINDGNLSFASVTGDANGDVTVKFNADSLSVSGDIDNAEASNFDIEGNSSEIELDETGKAYADANGNLSTEDDGSGSGASSGGSGGGGAGGGIAVVGAGAVLAGTAIAAKLKSDKATAALPDSSLIHVTENGNEKAFTTKVWNKKLTVSTEANTAVLSGSRSYIEQLSAQGIEQITLSAKTSDKILFVWPVTKKTTVNVSDLLNSTPQNGTFQVVLE